jgi:TonB family protein
MQNRVQRFISWNIFPVSLFTGLVGCITPGNLPVNDPAANAPSANNNSAPAKKPAEGNLSREEIEGVIRANLGQIKACYERSLQTNPNLKGRIMTSFEIAANGKVSRSEIANSTLNHQPTEQCVAQSIRRWQFPIPRGGGNVRVTYPFTLGPK